MNVEPDFPADLPRCHVFLASKADTDGHRHDYTDRFVTSTGNQLPCTESVLSSIPSVAETVIASWRNKAVKNGV